MALPAPDTHDIDHLLARYRTARAQQALFDVRGERAGTGYDEFVDAAGNVRPTWRELAECVGATRSEECRGSRGPAHHSQERSPSHA